MYNYNGLAEWKHFNGLAMNQGCGTVTGAGSHSESNGVSTAVGSGSSNQDYMYRES